jgi:hypothetical protein
MWIANIINEKENTNFMKEIVMIKKEATKHLETKNFSH